MKLFLKSILIIAIVFLTTQGVFASERLLVLPDDIQFNSTNYAVFPDSSVMFATDVINNLKSSKRLQIVSMKEVRDALRSSTRIRELALKSIKEYKYNCNVDFIDLKALARVFRTNKVLLISSTTDAQNYFLKRSWWAFINLPGAEYIDPSYRLNTFATLVDVDKEEILWEKTYTKSIRADELRIVANSFAPASEQLNKIKFYSTTVISPEIAMYVEDRLVPTYVTMPNKIPQMPIKIKTIEVAQKVTEPEIKQNIEPVKLKTTVKRPVLIQTPDSLESNSWVNDL
ncbi:hypothetical protein KBA27_01140 [bacterium]|nr:hypothetical protein [bacterium]